MRLRNENVGALAFADDVTFIPSPKAEVEAALRRVEVLCAASGTEINHINSVGLWLEGWATTPKRFAGIEWTTSIGDYLGVSVFPTKPRTAVWKRTAN